MVGGVRSLGEQALYAFDTKLADKTTQQNAGRALGSAFARAGMARGRQNVAETRLHARVAEIRAARGGDGAKEPALKHTWCGRVSEVAAFPWP